MGKLKQKVAFKTSIQLGGLINGVQVSCAPGGKYGIILCRTEEELQAIKQSPAYKKGKIVELKEAGTMATTEIMKLPSLNPTKPEIFRGQELLKYLSVEDLDKVSNLNDNELMELRNIIINYTTERLKEDGVEIKDIPVQSNEKVKYDPSSKQYRELLKAELNRLNVVFAKNATNKGLIDLLNEYDPDNYLLPKKTKEELEAELLEGKRGSIDI